MAKRAAQDTTHNDQERISADIGYHNRGYDLLYNELNSINPLFYDESETWWVWDSNTHQWRITDDIGIMVIVKTHFTIPNDGATKRQQKILDVLRVDSRHHKPQPFPAQWVQCRNTIMDINTGKTFPATSDYFCTNPHPHTIGTTTDTPIIDKLLKEWAGEVGAVQLKELFAYCMYNGYPLSFVFALIGGGRNGKSHCLNVLQRFIGETNCCSTEFEYLMTNRFETFKLYKKNVCLMSETSHQTMENSTMMKKLHGKRPHDVRTKIQRQLRRQKLRETHHRNKQLTANGRHERRELPSLVRH